MPRRVFLTGASSGIGSELAAVLVQRGWRVALAARSREALEALAGRIDPRRETTVVLPLDVADPDAVRAAVHAAAAAFQGLDAAVANAGIGIPSPAEGIRLEDLRRVFDVNLHGAAATLLHALPIVKPSPHALLAGISSIAAWRSGPGAAAYNASKAALSSFLECLRAELHDQGVRVLEVNPGFVRTPMTDRNTFAMPFLMDPRAAATRIAAAMERRSARLSFPWPAAMIMGLVRRLPDSLFDALNLRLARRLRETSVRCQARD